MKTELVRLTITITAEQKAVLAEWVSKTRTPASYLVRQLLEEHFKQNTGG